MVNPLDFDVLAAHEDGKGLRSFRDRVGGRPFDGGAALAVQHQAFHGRGDIDAFAADAGNHDPVARGGFRQGPGDGLARVAVDGDLGGQARRGGQAQGDQGHGGAIAQAGSFKTEHASILPFFACRRLSTGADAPAVFGSG